jgi:hypothetical protein
VATGGVRRATLVERSGAAPGFTAGPDDLPWPATTRLHTACQLPTGPPPDADAVPHAWTHAYGGRGTPPPQAGPGALALISSTGRARCQSPPPAATRRRSRPPAQGTALDGHHLGHHQLPAGAQPDGGDPAQQVVGQVAIRSQAALASLGQGGGQQQAGAGDRVVRRSRCRAGPGCGRIPSRQALLAWERRSVGKRHAPRSEGLSHGPGEPIAALRRGDSGQPGVAAERWLDAVGTGGWTHKAAKKAARSRARRSGSSAGAKWPPLGIRVQRRTL